MKILNVSAQKPNSTGSGIFLTELVKEFSNLENEQAVLAGVYRDDKVEIPIGTLFYPVYFNTDVLPFPIVGMSDEMPYPSTRYCDLTSEMLQLFRSTFLEKLEQAVEEFKPDIILCHHLYLLTSIVREHFPEKIVYGICHNTDLRQLEKTNLERSFIKENISKLNHIFALHNEQRENIAHIFNISKERITVIGMGYNSQIFYNQQIRKSDGKIRLAFAGKIAEKKGVKSLIKSLSYLCYDSDKLELYLAGGAGNRLEYEEIEKLKEQSKYKIYLLGKLSQKELANIYNLCDVFVLPSFSEGLPLTVIEALACKAKVVMSDLPGIKEWIDLNTRYANVIYVTPPEMINNDEPVDGSLSEFEKRIAQALVTAIEMKTDTLPDVSKISWESIAKKIIAVS